MAPKKKGSNVPAKRGSTTPANIPEQMALDAEGGSGFENVGTDDLAIPFIVILQALSPQVRGKDKVKGAREGDFYNTVTAEVLGDQIILIPCAYEKAYIEWVLRDNGGGFVQKHVSSAILDKCQRNDHNQNILPNGNQIVDTAYHYCLLVRENGNIEQVVIGLTSTQLKKSRKWNSMALSLKIKVGGRMITPPMFSHTYVAKTVEESNDQGTWSGWLIGEPKIIDDPDLYAAAKKLHDDVTKGQIRTSVPPPQDGTDLNQDSRVENGGDCF